MDRTEIKEILIGLLFVPLLLVDIWFACAFGRIWEDQVRCENGATEYCWKGE